jgi:hypothetical protein
MADLLMGRKSSIGGKTLLDLPAGESVRFCSVIYTNPRLSEIRNRIYAAAIAGEHYFPTLIAPRDANKRRFRTCVEDWHGSTRPLLCLTQVCCELRTEFRPIYMGHVHMLVSYAHIYEYLDLFVFQGKPAKDVKDPLCVVSLLVAEMDDNCDGVDLVPLLRLCKANPNIWFLVSMPGREEYAEQLQQMVQLNINDNESWWNFMSRR